MSRGKPFETGPPLSPLFPALQPGPGHVNPLFSSHLQAAVSSGSVPALHNPYFGLPNPFLPGVTGQKSPILGRQPQGLLIIN